MENLCRNGKRSFLVRHIFILSKIVLVSGKTDNTVSCGHLKNNEFFKSEKYFELANFLRANKNYTKSIELYEKSIASKKDKRDDTQ